MTATRGVMLKQRVCHQLRCEKGPGRLASLLLTRLHLLSLLQQQQLLLPEASGRSSSKAYSHPLAAEVVYQQHAGQLRWRQQRQRLVPQSAQCCNRTTSNSGQAISWKCSRNRAPGQLRQKQLQGRRLLCVALLVLLR